MRGLVLGIGLLAATAAEAKKPKPDAPPSEPTFQLAFPDALHATESVVRTRTRTSDAGEQVDVTTATSDVVLRATPGGWELVTTLTAFVATRNGAPAPDPISELMLGVPVLATFDAAGELVSVTGFEPIGARLAALPVPPDLRQSLMRALDPAMLAAKARADLESRLGLLAGQPTRAGHTVTLPAPGDAQATWTVGAPVPCPPGSCLAVDYAYPLQPGDLELSPKVSASLLEGTASGQIHVDPATGLAWREVREDDRVLELSLGAGKVTSRVRDHLERSWTIVE